MKNLRTILLIVALLWLTILPCPAQDQEPAETQSDHPGPPAMWEESEEEPSYVKVRASTAVGLAYTLPTATDDNDRRKQDQGEPNFTLRNTYIHFRGDIGKALVLLSLSAERIDETDANDDDRNNDDNAGRLVLGLDRATLGVTIHPALVIETGVIRLPWSWTSQAVWGLGLVANSAPRRYGLVEDSDLGLGFRGVFPEKVGGYHFAVYNGQDNVEPEDSTQKGTSLALYFAPFRPTGIAALSGFRFHVFGEYRGVDDPPGPELDRRISWAALLNYKLTPVEIGIEWMTTQFYYEDGAAPRNSGVGSGFVTVDLVWWAKVFARVDLRDPDLDQNGDKESTRRSLLSDNYLRSDEDGRMHVLTGAVFELGGNIAVAPFAETIFFQETDKGDPVPPTVTLSTSLQVRF